MSCLIEQDGRMYSFDEFCLSEAIKPRKCEWGTDYKNNEIGMDQYHFFTFTEYDGLYYSITIKIDGELGFGTSIDKVLDHRMFTDSEVNTRRVLKVFGSVMYVAIEMLKRMPFDKFFFRATSRTESMYNKMVKNKVFLESVRNDGWCYENDGDKHVFIKCEP